jgi:hypothetical protein
LPAQDCHCRFFIQKAALAAFAAAAMVPANALVIGTADSSNSIPIGGNGGGYYFQQVYSAASFAAGLDISSLTFYNYDTAAGNLMLAARTFDLGAGSLFLDVDQNVGLTNSRFQLFPNDWNQGLVTGFNEVAQVLLPAGLPLLPSGMGALGAMLRRRRAG